MKHFKTIILAIMATISLPSVADDYESIAVLLKDGSEVETNLSDFSVIKFEKGNMLFNNGAQTVKSFDMKTLQKMYFKTDATGVEVVDSNAGSEQITVFTTSGIKVGNSIDDLQKLPRGLYIVRQGNSAKKVMCR